MTKKRYEVSILLESWINQEVEAENSHKAEEIAAKRWKQILQSGIPDPQLYMATKIVVLPESEDEEDQEFSPRNSSWREHYSIT